MRHSEMNLLEIYLDDHWAGAAAGRSLAKRLYDNNGDTNWRDEFAKLVEQIEEDDQTLAEIRDNFGLDGGKIKRILALTAERVSRLKPNGRLITYSPLSRLLECEAMEAGISAKRRLWAGLHEGCADRPELDQYDLEKLMSRADAQLDLLRSFHAYAAKQAFGG